MTEPSSSSLTSIRLAEPADHPFLGEMLLFAAHWRSGQGQWSFEEVLKDEQLARYVEGWGRPGDVALIAEANGRPIGAAWYRLFSRAAPGYGFIDESTPELSLAVAPEHRRRGVGSALLDALLRQAKQDGHAAVSLSVEADNPTLRLYESRGFVNVEKVDRAWTLRLELGS